MVCDGGLMRNLVKNIRNAWRTTTGPGVTLIKGDSRWVLNAAAAASVTITGYRAATMDALAGSTVSLGTFVAGEYTAEYITGAFRYVDTDPYFATALGSNRIVYQGGTSTITPSSGFSSMGAAQSAGTWSSTFTHTGGAIYYHFEDVFYSDNTWGTPYGGQNPTFGILQTYPRLAMPDLATPTAYPTPYGYPYPAAPGSFSIPFYLSGPAGYQLVVELTLEARLPTLNIGATPGYLNGDGATIDGEAPWLIQSPNTGSAGDMDTFTTTVQKTFTGAGADSPTVFSLFYYIIPSNARTGAYVEITAMRVVSRTKL